MNARLAIKGFDENEEDVVIAIELQVKQQVIQLYHAKKKQLNEDEFKSILNTWSEGKDFEFDDRFEHESRSIMEESMLPENLKVIEMGKLRSQQNEWAYMIAMEKLWQSFVVELDELKSGISALQSFDKDKQEDLKSFWERVLGHRKERNISQQKLDEVKAEVDPLYNHLKKLKQEEGVVKIEQSIAAKEILDNKLQLVEEKIEQTKFFKPISAELKEIHGEWRKAPLRKAHRLEVKARIDKAFDTISEKIKSFQNNKYDKRIEGLNGVIKKMVQSIERDKSDLEFQKKRMNSSNVSQLEIQLREAKFKMIEDKITSKEEKLNDIRKTLEQLKARAGSQEKSKEEE